jgi:hypothetical protein
MSWGNAFKGYCCTCCNSRPRHVTKNGQLLTMCIECIRAKSIEYGKTHKQEKAIHQKSYITEYRKSSENYKNYERAYLDNPVNKARKKETDRLRYLRNKNESRTVPESEDQSS